jgi:hypothetical protein
MVHSTRICTQIEQRTWEARVANVTIVLTKKLRERICEKRPECAVYNDMVGAGNHGYIKILARFMTKSAALSLLLKQVEGMKTTKVILIVAASLFLVDIPLETMASAGKITAETTAIGRKRKGYKQKRGGLFNTGLFRKKNPCGCPNH